MADVAVLDRTTTATPVTESAKPYRGRRLSWSEFYSIRPDLKPANDNRPKESEERAA